MMVFDRAPTSRPDGPWCTRHRCQTSPTTEFLGEVLSKACAFPASSCQIGVVAQSRCWAGHAPSDLRSVGSRPLPLGKASLRPRPVPPAATATATDATNTTMHTSPNISRGPTGTGTMASATLQHIERQSQILTKMHEESHTHTHASHEILSAAGSRAIGRTSYPSFPKQNSHMH